MTPEILQAAPMPADVTAGLEQHYTVHRLWEAKDRNALLAQVGPAVRGVATDGHHGADAALQDALPALEIIACYGVGYEGIDADYARSRGVIVTNTPSVLDDDVANTAIMLILATTRDLVAYDRYVRDGRWEREGDPPLTKGIRGRTVGILGLGRIGKALAAKLEVFGPHVVYHGRHEQKDVPYRYVASLTEMARLSDVLVVVTPGGAATRHLVDREVLDALGPQGILINVARGSVVDEEALVAALQDGRLGGAGLDVFADEPRVPEALFAMDNVVLQPHQGSATVETRRAMGDLVLANLRAHFAGEPVLTPVAEMGRESVRT